MNRTALTVAMAAAFAAALSVPALAQEVPDAPTDVVETASPVVSPEAPKKPKKKGKESPWSFHTSLRHLSDSNLEQDENGTSSHGLIMGLGARYQAKLSGGDLDLSYFVADHSYTDTETWDRTTHDFEATYDRRLSRRWALRTTGEIALKDASDDGDIRDEYTLEQRFEYRISPVHRLRLEGALRTRDYQDDPGRDSNAPYAGIALDMRWSGGRRWLVGYRYDDIDADENRRSYRRSSIHTILERDLTDDDTVSLEAGYRVRRYTERLVSGSGGMEPRRDRYWQVEAAWDHTLREGLALRLDYFFENRRSNDSRRNFDDHLYGATLTHRW